MVKRSRNRSSRVKRNRSQRVKRNRSSRVKRSRSSRVKRNRSSRVKRNRSQRVKRNRMWGGAGPSPSPQKKIGRPTRSKSTVSIRPGREWAAPLTVPAVGAIAAGGNIALPDATSIPTPETRTHRWKRIAARRQARSIRPGRGWALPNSETHEEAADGNITPPDFENRNETALKIIKELHDDISADKKLLAGWHKKFGSLKNHSQAGAVHIIEAINTLNNSIKDLNGEIELINGGNYPDLGLFIGSAINPKFSNPRAWLGPDDRMGRADSGSHVEGS
jgi:hypothetical protein